MEKIRKAIIQAINRDPRSARQIAVDCRMNHKSIYKVINGEQVNGSTYESLALALDLIVRPRTETEKEQRETKRAEIKKMLKPTAPVDKTDKST